MNPYLLFEFPDEQGVKQPLVFTKPERVLKTNDINEVQKIFVDIERALNEGYYVAGFVSYEAAPAFHEGMQVKTNAKLPLIWFGIFKKAEIDYEEPKNDDNYSVTGWKMSSSREEYQNGFNKIKQAIKEGHTYQVNFTERLQAEFKGSGTSFYRQLTKNQQSNYNAYLDFDGYSILSASPELFFKVHQNKITTKPMKGTAKRGRNTAEDNQILKQLLESEKERAENLMIVDLLRNDLNRIANSGSVHVSKLFEAETYPTVHQLTSRIEAELSENLTVFDWFKALFPCGSITGAPKISTMNWISRLEKTPREVYCGAIGYITPAKNAIFNVPIRTVVINKEEKTATYGVGGGITWDSTAEGEFEELYTKAKVLTENRPEFQLLESILLQDGEFPLLPYHLDRLRDSAGYFKFPLLVKDVRQKLADCAAVHPEGLYKIRLLVDKQGTVSIEVSSVSKLVHPVDCAISTFPINHRDPFLFHKTTYRQVYEQHQLESDKPVFSVLLWNENEELTEFTIGNLVIEKDGKYITPPVASGLLAGTYRQFLLNSNEISEQIIYKHDLEQADSIWLINSIRGWLKVNII